MGVYIGTIYAEGHRYDEVWFPLYDPDDEPEVYDEEETED